MITKTIIISARKGVTLQATFCTPGIKSYVLAVTPLMSKSVRLDAFQTPSATETVTVTLVAGESGLFYKVGDRVQPGGGRQYPVLNWAADPGKISTSADFTWPFPGPAGGWFVPANQQLDFRRYAWSNTRGVVAFNFYFGSTFVQPNPSDPLNSANHPSLYQYSLAETNGLGGPSIGPILATGRIRIQLSGASPTSGDGICKYEILQ